MPRPSPESLRLAQSWRLALLETPPRGHAGARLGRGTGASLEFQDRRTYALGDDVRHLDWRAYARTDQWLVRQYREEILPRVEILLDVSRSMAIDAEKAQAAVDVVALLSIAAQNEGFHVVIAKAGDVPELVDPARFEATGAEFEGREPWTACLSSALGSLRRGSMRVLVSDFLFPHDASALVRPIAAQGGGLALIQILGRTDSAPEVGAALRLTDVESGATQDLVLDRRSVERYQARLSRLTDALEGECRRAGARFVSCGPDLDLGTACRTHLAPAGILSAG